MSRKEEVAQVLSQKMDSVMKVFSPPTPEQELVEKATSELLIGSDWGLNMEICDLIQNSPDGPRNVMKAIRKRLTNKNPKIVLLALTLLEACVKNCSLKFHVCVATREVMEQIVKLSQLNKQSELAVKDKALELIQDWGEAFKGQQHQLPVFYEIYRTMRAQNVRFPQVEATAPIFTPPPKIPNDNISREELEAIASQDAHPSDPEHHQYHHQQQRRKQIKKDKLREDLDLVKTNTEILSDILASCDPSVEDIRRNDLAMELVDASRAMQPRVLALVSEVGDGDLVEELLLLNDGLNRVLGEYEQLVAGVKPARQPASTTTTSSSASSEAPLVSFEDSPVPRDHMAIASSASAIAPPAMPAATAAPVRLAPPTAAKQAPAQISASLTSDLLGLDDEDSPLVLKRSKPATKESSARSSSNSSSPLMAPVAAPTTLSNSLDDLLGSPPKPVKANDPLDDEFSALASKAVASVPHTAAEDDFDDFLRSRVSEPTGSTGPAQANPSKDALSVDDEFDSFLNSRSS